MTFLDTPLAKVSPLKVFRILLVEGLHLGLLLRFVVVRRRTLVESLIGVARVGWGIRLSRHVVTFFVVAQLVVVVVWLDLRLMGREWCDFRGEGDVGGTLALDGAGGFGVVRRSCLGSVGHGGRLLDDVGEMMEVLRKRDDVEMFRVLDVFLITVVRKIACLIGKRLSS